MSNLRFKVGDRAKVVAHCRWHNFEIGDEVEIINIDTRDIRCKSIPNGLCQWLSDSELAPIESFEEKTAKAFEEIANGTGPEMVVISAEEYANFQEMEKLLATIMNDERALIGHYIPEIEKLLKQKYNP